MGDMAPVSPAGAESPCHDEAWLIIPEEDPLLLYKECQATMLTCADRLSRRVMDDESLASQLTTLARLHHQIQQIEALDHASALSGPSGYRALTQLAQGVCLALCEELSVEGTALSPSLCKQLDAVSSVAQLCIKLMSDVPPGELYSSAENSHMITQEGESLYEQGEWQSFYEAAHTFGLQLDPSMRKPLWLIVLATSSIKSNDPDVPAPSLLAGGLKLARSLVCGHSVTEIVDSRGSQDVSVIKQFWDLPESVIVGNLPKMVLPSVALDQVFHIPSVSADSVQLRIISNTYVSFSPPDANQVPLLSSLTSQDVPLHPHLVFHVHGGGFVAQSSFSHEVYLRHWASALPEAVIVSVDYPTAPESPYPAALHSVLDAYEWCLENPSQIGWGGESVVLVGDSAGANLVASLCVHLAQHGSLRMPGGLVLVYPALYLGRRLSPSRLLSMWDPMLPKNMLQACVEAYLPPSIDPDADPLVSPLTASDDVLAKFPWTYCVAAGCDPLLDDSTSFTQRLRHNGVRASVQVMDGLSHGFLHFGLVSPACHRAVLQTASQLGMMLEESGKAYQQEQERAALKLLHAEMKSRLAKARP